MDQINQKQALYRSQAIWKSSGVPERHRQLVMDRKEIDGEWGKEYRRLSASAPTILVLLGPRGTGKTQMAVCLMADLCAEGRTVRYLKTMDLFREVRACYRAGGPDEIRVVEAFCRVGCLVLDEAHERSDNDWENRTLGNIIDKRYDAMRQTIIVSNQSPEKFQETAGASLVSRIQECGDVVECDWPSFR